MQKSCTVYIEPRDDGKPCQSISDLTKDVFDAAGLHHAHLVHSGLSNRPGKGRKKVVITITVQGVR